MTTASTGQSPMSPTATPVRLPPLESGDRLSRAEFELRYEASRERKAELVEGVVHMPPPVLEEHHGAPHLQLATCLGLYVAATSGVIGADNSSLRLDLDNEPQPDLYLRLPPERGGQTRKGDDGFIIGAPELIAEVAASSASYDLHQKLNAYRRNGVREYLVWRTYDGEFDFFALRDGHFQPAVAGADSIYRSTLFPGLWLDTAALLRADFAGAVRAILAGTASPEHADFVTLLQRGSGR